MKSIHLAIILLITLFATSCSKDLETTGRAIISFDNQTLFNQEDYFVDAGIVFQESDSGIFISIGMIDISEGGFEELQPIELNIGNYYIRYQYFLGNSPTGGERHQPFQIKAGEDTEVRIIR